MLVLAGLNPNVTDLTVMSWIALFVYKPVQNVRIICLQAQGSHLTSNIYLFVVYLLAMLVIEIYI
jgi:hypothetical protein